MRKKANDVRRDGWSAHKLADESGYAIDMKQKLKQGDVDDDRARTKRPKISARGAAHTSLPKREGSRKKSSTTRRAR